MVAGHKSLADEVYERVHRMIVDGDIGQGARVVEAQVAKELNVSRAPVREAVNRLAQEGLLETRPHQGPTVVQMTPEKIRWLYELRVGVESVAVRELTRRKRRSEFRRLRMCIADMRKAARQQDLRGVVECESQFHGILCELSGNPYVQAVNASLSALVRLALAADNAAYADLESVAEEHEPLVAAMETGDEAAAVSAITHHIMASIRDRVPDLSAHLGPAKAS